MAHSKMGNANGSFMILDMCDKFDSAFALAAAQACVTSGQGHLGIPAAAGVVNSSRASCVEL